MADTGCKYVYGTRGDKGRTGGDGGNAGKPGNESIFASTLHLRMVPPFVTAHTFCASRVWSEIFKFLKEEGHSRNGVFFEIANKKITLS